ncbi:MAG: anthranilate phosphoribosyltransferase [Planctomycetia bacterium]|nr:anthranilate phosphoribosyltransferase [Planctomycetia bacterium]
MHAAIEQAIIPLLEKQDVPEFACRAAVAAIMDGQCDEVSIAAFLTALRVKGESVDEIVGAARAMSERAERVPTERKGLLDTCGTGGDELRTLNISTATAIVAAACGVPVAKHGNRSVSSSSGSADVLEALGVNTQLTPAQVGRCIDEVGIGFCFAPVFHGAMRHAVPVRKALRFRTLFNLLGPLTNPAQAEFQLLGASRIAMAEKLAHASSKLGRSRVLVVCGNDQLDEVSLWGETTVFEVVGEQVSRLTWTAATFGFPECSVDQLRVSSSAESAARLKEVFDGVSGPARDIIAANVAAALIAASVETAPRNAAKRANQVITDGKAAELLNKFIEFTQTLATQAG